MFGYGAVGVVPFIQPTITAAHRRTLAAVSMAAGMITCLSNNDEKSLTTLTLSAMATLAALSPDLKKCGPYIVQPAQRVMTSLWQMGTLANNVRRQILSSPATRAIAYAFNNIVKPLATRLPVIDIIIGHASSLWKWGKWLTIGSLALSALSLLKSTYDYLYPVAAVVGGALAYIPGASQVPATFDYYTTKGMQIVGNLALSLGYKLIIEPIITLGWSYIQTIAESPFTALATGIGYVVNFTAVILPKVTFSFVTALDAKAWAMILSYITLVGYLSSLIAPSNVKFTPITYPSIIKKALSQKVQKFLDGYKHRLAVGWLYGKLFSFEEKPVLNVSTKKEIEAIRKGMFNARNHRDGVFSNLLLVGPPGTGKTMVAEKIAEESGCNFVSMSGSSIKYYIDSKNTHLKKFEQIFTFAYQTSWWKKLLFPNRPTVLFIDEIDAFAKDLYSGGSYDVAMDDIQTLFKAKTGTPNNKVMVIGTTNHIKKMDSAILSRFSSIIYLDKPDFKARKEILTQYIDKFLPEKKTPERATSLNSAGIDRIAAQTASLSGRELQYLALRLKQMRAFTDNNRLTEESLDTEVYKFLKQRRLVERSFAGRFAEPLFDFKHFTLARWKRAIARAFAFLNPRALFS